MGSEMGIRDGEGLVKYQVTWRNAAERAEGGGVVDVEKVFFFKQKTAYEMLRSLVGSEMCVRDSTCRASFDSLGHKSPLNGCIPAQDTTYAARRP